MVMCSMALEHGRELLTAEDLAERHDLTPSTLRGTLTRLRKADLVGTVRGPGGGYCLARRPEEITLAEIARAAEERAAAQEWESRFLLDDVPLMIWHKLSLSLDRSLERLTLADLMDPVRELTVWGGGRASRPWE